MARKYFAVGKRVRSWTDGTLIPLRQTARLCESERGGLPTTSWDYLASGERVQSGTDGKSDESTSGGKHTGDDKADRQQNTDGQSRKYRDDRTSIE
ncbi:unnamed protein product [Linum trigynum]|uniref:Uncharacterized protein n=1 Tax=Linum trigynum TaxID=586398 RepID=A0AAV2GQF5_9ROSI